MTIADRLATVDVAMARVPRPLAGLVDRLTAEGRLRGARAADGRPIAPGALGDRLVAGLSADSRAARPGSLFVAVPGDHVDGHDYLASAAGAGAVAAVVEHPVGDVAIIQLVVDRSRAALASASGWWYGDPSRELGVVGITGTDGKTTTSFLAAAALDAAGHRSGLVGTVELRVGGEAEPTPEHQTTPEAPELQRLVRAMADAGDEVAILETTSHGLALERVAGIAYDVAIFTNLTHEHLELHGSFEAYRAAKLSLFERLAGRGPAKTGAGAKLGWPRLAVINRDDPSAELFIAVAREAGARVVTYGAEPGADVRADRIEEDAHRLSVHYEAPSGAARIDLHLAGRFNAHNALAAVALGEGLGLDPAAVRAGLEDVPGVPGRMERIELGQPFSVIVDYAHSPASLETVLDLLGPLAAARGGGLIAVFGSAGERDRDKRAMMGRIAGDRCRLVVVTDEDPRGEDPLAILEAIGRGAEAAGRRRDRDLLLIPDRRAAIAAALDAARPSDVVLFAGKGHERSIIGPTGPAPWNERAEVEAALARLGYAAG
ncbi:MAG TPA: UDP-N-acetylmuramoyl-L-alanyl-D-glutamate--2,6-diaminopimelate ligase [Candidatus Limnocylindrales bacterium]